MQLPTIVAGRVREDDAAGVVRVTIHADGYARVDALDTVDAGAVLTQLAEIGRILSARATVTA